jgi:hypothetical protein
MPTCIGNVHGTANQYIESTIENKSPKCGLVGIKNGDDVQWHVPLPIEIHEIG